MRSADSASAFGFSPRQPDQLLDQLRHADQLFGEIRTVLEEVERDSASTGIRVEQRQPGVGSRHHFFEEMLEAPRATPQLGFETSVRRVRARADPGSGAGCWRAARGTSGAPTSAGAGGGRCVVGRPLRMDDPLVDFLHRFQMRVQLVQQLFTRGSAAELRDRHVARQQIQIARRGGSVWVCRSSTNCSRCSRLRREAIGRSQARIFGGREQVLVAEPRQRQQRTAVPHPRVPAAVQPLQALHQKLDIADAAGRQLDVECRSAAGAAGCSFSLMRSRVTDTASTAEKSRVVE